MTSPEATAETDAIRVAIEHLGTKATVEIPANPMSPAARALMAKHDDSFVSGPPWSEFAKEMGLDGDTAKTAGSVYAVSVYRAALLICPTLSCAAAKSKTSRRMQNATSSFNSGMLLVKSLSRSR